MQSTINGVSLAYDDVGTGQAVVLIHGFPLNRKMWEHQQQALAAEGYRVIIPDIRGFGDSQPFAGPASMDVYADDVVALLDMLEIKKAVIGGMSMGGYVLLSLLDRYPDRIAGACFIVTRSNSDDEATRARRSTLAEEARKGKKQIITDVFNAILFSESTVRARLDLVRQVGEWMQQNSSEGLAAALLAMRDRRDYTSALSRFSIPSLVISADQDRAVPAESTKVLAEGLPNCRTCIIPSAGHLANIEQPELFNRCLLEFMKGINW